jgi:rhodanese-related sulfurtransferase
MKLTNILVATALLSTTATFANDFINYKQLTKELKSQNTKNGTFATTSDVKHALKSKDWAVVDVRTNEEWQAASIKGSSRIGRQSPEKALESVVLDDDDNFVKQNIIVVCNSASRASVEAETFKKMGFKQVKIYPIYRWIDECNPVVTRYSKKKDKHGSKRKFGNFYAEFCKR